ncbi:DUF2207 domain-containing protein [Microbacterium marinilacus]|uniref:Predicted membrane protein YciQ-like C-terminal domain-containing protein n=1 Tax=Microbacterium marinilacus TaxID=415209 RepID=A0ABP7B1V2_9MICO|nr:DUF2207 domain-containing protein [Microbacterium marinilacus]MBY0688647.1 DUF2207 domain-containing protein [Microbacterium marinilacus]
MLDADTLIGFLLIGAVLVLVAFVVIGITTPFARRLPRSPIVQYVPPEGDLFAHGLLVRADRRLLAAAVTSLAIRGAIRVLAPRGSRGPVAVEILAGAPLSADEHALLRALRPERMRPRQERRYARALAELGVHAAPDDAPDVFFIRGRGAFRAHRRRELRTFFDALRERVKAEGLAHKRTVSVHLVLLSLLFLAAAVAGVLLGLGAILNGEWMGAVVVLFDVAVLFWVLTLAPPPLLWFTALGQEHRRHLSGLRDYIRLAEQDRLRLLQSPEGALRTPAGALTPGGQALGLSAMPTAGDPVAQSGLDRYVLNERLLPYAILFRQERRWERELESLGGPDVSQNVRVLGSTLEGVMAVVQVIVIIVQVLRIVGVVLSLFGRSSD